MEMMEYKDLVAIQLTQASLSGLISLYLESKGAVLPLLPFRSAGVELTSSDDDRILVLSLEMTARVGGVPVIESFLVNHRDLMSWLAYVNRDDLQYRVRRHLDTAPGIIGARVLNEKERVLRLEFSDQMSALRYETLVSSSGLGVLADPSGLILRVVCTPAALRPM